MPIPEMEGDEDSGEELEVEAQSRRLIAKKNKIM